MGLSKGSTSRDFSALYHFFHGWLSGVVVVVLEGSMTLLFRFSYWLFWLLGISVSGHSANIEKTPREVDFYLG